jgi:hypothetical protein
MCKKACNVTWVSFLNVELALMEIMKAYVKLPYLKGSMPKGLLKNITHITLVEDSKWNARLQWSH